MFNPLSLQEPTVRAVWVLGAQTPENWNCYGKLQKATGTGKSPFWLLI